MNFGLRVAGVGDVDGDATPDFLVGAPSDVGDGPATGSAWLFSGETGGLLYKFDGDHDSFGTSLAGGSDLNGDGRAEVIIGALGTSQDGTHAGSVGVYAGNDTYLNIDPTSAAVGETVSITLAEGDAGTFANLWTASIDGVPVFLRIVRLPLDSQGRLPLALNVTPELAGLTLELWSFVLHEGKLAFSEFEVLNLLP